MADDSFIPHRILRPGITRVEAHLQRFAFPPHSHDHICVGLVWHGAFTSRYGLHRYTVERGDVLLVDAGEVHDGRPEGVRGRRSELHLPLRDSPRRPSWK